MATRGLHSPPRPKLIIFDLDYTLWPFWVDTHVDGPFRKRSDGKVFDSRDKRVKHYPDVPAILQQLTREGYTLAVASRTSEMDNAEQLLHLFDWNKYFTFKQIYPGSKKTHFNNFQRSSRIEYKDMLFFDDEHRNIRDVSQLGVTCVLAEDGMSMAVLRKGLQKYALEQLSGHK